MQALVRKQAQGILIATMHDVGIRCVDLRHVALPTALYLQCGPVLSTEVRACCVLYCRLHRHWQESGFRRYDLEIEVARDFSVTQQGISLSLGVSLTSRVLKESFPRRASYGCRRLLLHRHAKPNFRFGGIIFAQTQVSFRFKLTFPKKSLSSPIMLCSRALSNVRNRACLTSDCMYSGFCIFFTQNSFDFTKSCGGWIDLKFSEVALLRLLYSPK